MRLLQERTIPGESAETRLRQRARRSIAATIAAGAEDYVRARHLPRLLPLTPRELADESDVARRAIVARLARALRAERSRGRAGHWTYDLNRHIALNQAYAAERRLLSIGDRPPDGHAKSRRG